MCFCTAPCSTSGAKCRTGRHGFKQIGDTVIQKVGAGRAISPCMSSGTTFYSFFMLLWFIPIVVGWLALILPDASAKANALPSATVVRDGTSLR